MTTKQLWQKIHKDEAEHEAAKAVNEPLYAHCRRGVRRPELKMAKAGENAPVVGAIREARRKFYSQPIGKLQHLFDEESRWRRKQTIATNKLAEVRERIYDMATRLAIAASEPTSLEESKLLAVPEPKGKTLMQLAQEGKL